MTNVVSDSSALVIYRRLLGYVRPHWRAFLISLLSLAAVAGAETSFAALMKPMLDGSFIERDPEVIRWVPLAIIVLFLVHGGASYLSAYWMNWIARSVIKRLRSEMFDHLLRLPVSFFDLTAAGTLLSKLVYDVEQVARAASEVVSNLVRDLLTVVGLLAWMVYINWMLALVLLLGTPVIALVINRISRSFRRYSRRIQDSMGDVTRIAEETIEGLRVVKTFGGEGYERERFEQANERNRALNMRMETASAASVPVVQLVAAVGAAGVIYVATLPTILAQLTVGSFVSFVAAMMMLLGPVKRLTKVNATLMRGISAAESVFQFIDLPPEWDEGEGRCGRVRGDVEYREVSFAYDPQKGPVLDRISFRAEPGRTIAFVGGSGGGKSTLASLLPRFYDVSAGQILLDGRDIRELSLVELRDQFALVSQHIVLFNDTIANNIAYGRLRGASRSAIEQAAAAAHAMEFIQELPAGLDTVVGDNGVLLSGGQRQRIAIARALLKDAPVLILDEATSALDTESERHFQAALERLMEGRTTLVIAHRLSTIERADRIVVIERGQVVESGSHAELLTHNGRYAQLYRMSTHSGVVEA